jgi:hypothetical protein
MLRRRKAQKYYDLLSNQTDKMPNSKPMYTNRGFRAMSAPFLYHLHSLEVRANAKYEIRQEICSIGQNSGRQRGPSTS